MKIIKRGLDKIGRKNERKIRLETATFSWWSGFTLVNVNTIYLPLWGVRHTFLICLGTYMIVNVHRWGVSLKHFL